MRMIYGSINPANTREQVDAEKQKVACMMAALGSYPWDSHLLRELSGGVFGIHSRGEHSAALPIDGGPTIIADVRLDNRRELYIAFGMTAAEGAALDDSDLILHAYQKWGTDCASHLLGDFAFALWDEANARLFCARDFIGTRPFYYYHVSGRMVFASDLLAMASHPDVPMELDLPFVVVALQTTVRQVVRPEHTYYQAIEKLPPAHALTLDKNGLRLWSYWQPGQTPERRYAHESDYVEELLALLHEAVACRVASSYPIGAHITGGLDSTSVAVLAHRILQKEARSFTGFSWAPPLPNDPADLLPNDERKLVEEVRAAEGMTVCYTNLRPDHVLAHARRDITLQPTTTLLAELAASEEAAHLGIRTLLSGWGGDELVTFNGRGYFPDLLMRGRWLTLQREISLRVQLHGGVVWRQWIFDGLLPLLPIPILKRLRPKDYPPPPPLSGYLRPEFAASLLGVKSMPTTDSHKLPGVRNTQIALLNYGHLSYRMESWASHGATLGISYVFPLLDRRIVEFALSIPDYLFFKNGWKRYLYRTAMQGILPDHLRWQKVKEDPAMIRGSVSIHKAAEEQLRTELSARKDNPYVDVAQLQAAVDAEQVARVADDNLSEIERSRLRAQRNAGNGRWLAFVTPKAL